MIFQFLLGLILAILIASLAWKAGSLSSGGVWAAALMGWLIFGLGGLSWAIILLAFFVSSSALSRAFHNQKVTVQEKFSKGAQRDGGQVFANGGLGIILVILHTLLPGQTWPWVGYVGAMAAVNADTWATELGVLSKSPPRLITWWKNGGQKVDKGTSGGVTWLGTWAALAGASLIGLLGAFFLLPAGFGGGYGGFAFGLLVAAALGGLVGSLFDSLLGATVQTIYYCPICAKETERTPRHTCGNETIYRRGWRWMNNDWVNVFCAVLGALVTVGVWGCIGIK